MASNPDQWVAFAPFGATLRMVVQRYSLSLEEEQLRYTLDSINNPSLVTENRRVVDLSASH